jgi:hypothetical protein
VSSLLRNTHSIVWDRHVGWSFSHSKVLKGVPDLWEPVYCLCDAIDFWETLTRDDRKNHLVKRRNPRQDRRQFVECQTRERHFYPIIWESSRKTRTPDSNRFWPSLKKMKIECAVRDRELTFSPDNRESAKTVSSSLSWDGMLAVSHITSMRESADCGKVIETFNTICCNSTIWPIEFSQMHLQERIHRFQMRIRI